MGISLRYRLVSRRMPCGAAALVLAATVVGCASYPERTAGALRAFQSGQFEEAMLSFGDPETTGSEFLSGAEAGTAALAAGDWEQARLHFDRAAAASADIEGRALLGPDALAEGLGSWVLNDTTRAYQGEGFERVFVHSGLALAYLAQGDLEAVYVEGRRANQLLEAEEKLYEKEYRAGGLGHFLSGLSYELLGELDQAYIDYKRMEEKGVGTDLAGRALVRLATELNRDDELPTWIDRYGLDPGRAPGAANIVLVAGVGMGPYKIGSQLPIPTPDGLITISGASYAQRPQPVSALVLRAEEEDLAVQSVVVEDVAYVAAENLQDRIAWSTVKSVARGLLKRELTKSLEREMGAGGQILGDLFSLITERPDLRAWQTLPAAWHAARLFVAPGAHTLSLEAIGGGQVPLGTYQLEPGETMIVLVRTLGARLYPHVIGGQPLEEALAARFDPFPSGSPDFETTPDS